MNRYRGGKDWKTRRIAASLKEHCPITLYTNSFSFVHPRMSGQLDFAMNNDEKVALLEELHRPLEEHWSVKSKFGLDAKGSEYIYKHHITRLQDIYSHPKHEYPEAPGLLYMSPVSQLYGVHGLNVVEDERTMKKKEGKWVSNFQKHAFLSDNGTGEKQRADAPARSSSPVRNRAPLYGDGRGDSRKRKEEPAVSAQNKKGARSKCYDQSIAREDLVMLGLYRLDEAQEEIYRNFVQMISSFDDFDKANIVEDAVKDAQGEDELLECYGGTVLPEPAARGSTGTAPGYAHPPAASPPVARGTVQLHATAGTVGNNGATNGAAPGPPRTAGEGATGGRSSRRQ